MAQFIAFRKDVEVLGQAMHSMLDAMSAHLGLARRIFARHGMREIKLDAWYPLQRFLDAFRDVAKEIGEHTLLAIGKKIPEHAVWPPEIQDVEAALRSIDVAYHMNHRLAGEAMFDPATGAMKEGIGNYRCERAGRRRILMICDTPYPSEFDRGIILGMGRQFIPTIEVELDTGKPTRKSGADSCTYGITW